MRHINKDGIDLIKRFEGFSANAYLCPAGVWTIGYGTTRLPNGTPVRAGMSVDEPTAESYLRHDVERFERVVDQCVSVSLTDSQFSALVSFTYNVGPGALRSSTLLRKLNAGDYADVPYQLSRWDKAGGRVLRGLTLRREAEGALFQREEVNE